jgi:N-acetylglucosamine-6-phosphate deacetylase
VSPRPVLFAHAEVWTPEQAFRGWVRVAEGRVAALGPGEPPRPTPGDELVDAEGLVLAPGFVDLHVHGAAGYDLLTGGSEALAAVAAFLVRTGCTAFLPTTVAAPWDETRAALAVWAEACARPPEGARPVGIHLEGPFLNPQRAGMQPRAHLRLPDAAWAEALLGAGRGWVRTVTLAPELPGGQELVASLARRGVAVSLGHSEARYEEVVEAVARGARRVTHAFNAMSALHHRAPGLVGALLDLEGLAAEAIADGVHLHPAVLRLLWRTKGWRRVALVTDAMAGAGAPDGVYRFGGQEVRVADGAARLADGTLAGSVVTLDRAVRTAVAAGVPRRQAVGMATLVPAEAVGLTDAGRLAPGARADLVALDPADRVVWTMVGGAWAWRA